MAKKVIVIGAGLGGMACAARLGFAGYEVTVVEKNPRTGGKMDLWEAEGFRWDTGPSVLTMPFIARHLFQDLSADLDDYLELVEINPSCRYFFPEGQSMHTWSDRKNMVIEIARREGDYGKRYRKFYDYAKGIYDLSADSFLFRKPGDWKGLFKASNLGCLKHLPKVLSLSTMAGKIQRTFKHPHVRQLFNRFATYTGSSPFKTPSTFNVIAYTELAFGSWYVRGGMYRLAAAMERLCREKNVQFMLGAEVEEIVVDARRHVQGVKIKGRDTLPADAVVVNGDVIDAWTNLLKYPGKQSVEKRLSRRPLSSAGFIVLLGVGARIRKLEHHNVFFCKDYRAEFDDIFKRRIPPTDPTIYVSASVRTDPSQAPEGKDNLFILVNTPAIQPNFSWKEEKEHYSRFLIEQLERRGLLDLSRQIVCKHIISPLDFADRYYAHRGAIYGHAYHSLRSMFRRPKNRSSKVRGLYYAGGSVRPGGGIPLVLLSGKHAFECIREDLPPI